MGKYTKGRTTVYNYITSDEKMQQVNPDNIQLENDYLDYLTSIDRSQGTIYQYRNNLHVFWCWNLEFNKNKFFVKLTKREISKFQSHAINVWGWSPKRIRTVKATLSSLSNFIENILDDEFEGYKPIINKIESPADITVRDKTIFSEKDLQVVLDKLIEDGQYMKACVLSLAMNSGRRKSELCRFKVSYFDKKNLICEGALYLTPEKLKTKGRGTNGKPLNVYVLAKEFQPYLDMWLEERKKLGIRGDWLFPKRQGGKWLNEPMSIGQLNSWAKSFSKMQKKHFYWHSIRHFTTTSLKEKGIPEDIIQEMIGWESSDMVRLYNDQTTESKLDKYFGADGIKKVKDSSLIQL